MAAKRVTTGEGECLVLIGENQSRCIVSKAMAKQIVPKLSQAMEFVNDCRAFADWEKRMKLGHFNVPGLTLSACVTAEGMQELHLFILEP